MDNFRVSFERWLPLRCARSHSQCAAHALRRPQRQDAIVLVAAANDAYVSQQSVASLKQHYPNATLRQVTFVSRDFVLVHMCYI